MSRLRKILVTIYSIYMVVVLMACYFVLKPSEVTNGFINAINTEMLANLIAIGVVLILINLIISLLKKPNEAYLVLGDNDGSIKLSNRAIERTVLNCLDRYEPIVEKTVSVKIKSKEGQEPKVDVMAKCGIKEECFEPMNRVKLEPKVPVDLKEGDLELTEDTGSDVTLGLERDLTDDLVGDSLEKVCSQVQEEAHRSLENLLGFRIGKLDMKFYHVKEKTDKTAKMDKQNKKSFNKKVSRVK